MTILDIAYKKLDTHEEKVAALKQAVEEFPVLKEMAQRAKKLKIRTLPDKKIPGSAWETGNVYLNTHWMETLQELLYVFVHELTHIKQMQEGRLSQTHGYKDGNNFVPPVLKYKYPDNDETIEHKYIPVKTPEEYMELPWEKEANETANKVLKQIGIDEMCYLTWAHRYDKKIEERDELSFLNVLKRAYDSFKAERSSVAVRRAESGETIIVFGGSIDGPVREHDGTIGNFQIQEIFKE